MIDPTPAPPAPRAAHAPPWPQGARLAVGLAFDLDADCLVPMKYGEGAPDQVALTSMFQYGPLRGVPRLLTLLESVGVPATFFIPGWTVERYPDVVRAIAAAGHELGHHGYLHRRPNAIAAAEEREEMTRGLAAFDEILGLRPRGYRAPAFAFGRRTLELLLEHGFAYDASLLGDDVPYRLQGAGGSLVEVPTDLAMDDWMHYVTLPDFGYSLAMKAPDAAMAVYRAELEAAYRQGACWVTVWHPAISGRPARAAAIAELLQDLKTRGDVWFATLGQMADHVAGLERDGTWQPLTVHMDAQGSRPELP